MLSIRVTRRYTQETLETVRINQRMNPPTTQESKEWLELAEAAAFLGVHYTTLRRWADEGAVDCARTPGGRRRFRRAALQQFVARMETSGGTAGITAMQNAALSATRRELGHLQDQPHSWLQALSADQRACLRSTGSTLMALLVQYTSRAEPAEAILQEGRAITGQYAQICFQAGLTMDQTMRAFQFFQRSILDSTHEAGAWRGVADTESLRLYRRTTTFFDELIVELIARYNQIENAHLIVTQGS